MRLNVLWEFRTNAIEMRLIVDLVLGVLAFLAGIFFDPIAKGFFLYHAKGFGSMQVVWCAVFGGYIIWTIYQMRDWKE